MFFFKIPLIYYSIIHIFSLIMKKIIGISINGINYLKNKFFYTRIENKEVDLDIDYLTIDEKNILQNYD